MSSSLTTAIWPRVTGCSGSDIVDSRSNTRHQSSDHQYGFKLLVKIEQRRLRQAVET